MHQTVSFGGPVMWFLAGVLAIAFFGAIFELVDLARRPNSAYGSWTRLPWLPLPMLLTLGVLVAIISYLIRFHPVLTSGYGLFLFLMIFANIIQLPAYLLRVVYPTDRRREALRELHGEPPTLIAVTESHDASSS